ncbi:hypothetical protein CJF42_22865 [Pseudoalteromonas sp. NBT06-2]|nr:hypothetical protein CJF42_22865 [Pseudoalteromonas sp. NBT06-2]
MSDLIKELALNNFASVKVITIGNEKTPLLVIDNFANNAQRLLRKQVTVKNLVNKQAIFIQE